MRRKVFWLLLSCIALAALVVTSCTPAGETTAPTSVQGTVSQPGTPVVTPTSAAPTTSTAPVTQKSDITKTPAYGGVLRVTQALDTVTFDDCYTWSSASVSWSLNITNDEMLDGDWSAGPEGRGETSWLLYKGYDAMERYENGYGLAESYTVDASALTVTWKMKKGVRFAMNPGSAAARLVNGREMTADDVVATINRQWAVPVSFFATTNANLKPISVTATDKYTVVIKFDKFGTLSNTLLDMGDLIHIWPKEALTTYNNDLRDWRLSVGTGPFVLKDYVKGASATYDKNPDFWKTYNVQGPGYGKQLPFVDGLKVLVITDKSTRMAALRTGKVDQSMGYTYEDANAMLQTNPELKDVFYVEAFAAIHLRLDDPTFPWSNLKVRQAMMMSMDYTSIVKNFYQGHAEMYTNTTTMPEYKDLYVPLKDLPADVQELYSYNVDKAKQYLKDAGYEKGFTASVVTSQTFVDVLSIYKDYFAKVGITLNLDVHENAVYNSVLAAKTEKEMICRSENLSMILQYAGRRFGHQQTRLGLNDPVIEKSFKDVWDNWLDWGKRTQIYKENTPYVLRQAYLIPFPAFENHTLWEPWIMGYKGEYGTGNSDLNTFTQYVWLDLDMRQKMTGQR